MSTKRRYSLSEAHVEEHLKLLNKLESLPLADSCCDICHCDCINSHRSDTDECCSSKLQVNKDTSKKCANSLQEEGVNAKVRKQKCASTNSKTNYITKTKQHSNDTILPNGNLTSTRKPRDTDAGKKRKVKKRSKSVVIQRNQSQCTERLYVRDCKILQDLLTSFDNKNLADLEITGKAADSRKDFSDNNNKNTMLRTSKTPLPLTLPHNVYSFSYLDETDSSFAPIRLSESMANLCLAPPIKEAYEKVPDHDKRILNRMATKRSEQALAKENAWLARKYWENERYERELLKCEQMEEYKKAVRDKQFQDYLHTKARLNEIAQRDLSELKRLKESLQQKNDKVKKRLHNLRTERDLMINQKRCEEMRKMEYVNLHQEEHNLDEMLRKSETCHRLTERLKRADFIRQKMLENYLKRLRYDNYIEQLQHEEHWREVQLNEQLKREQLKEQISRKRCRSQHFVEAKQLHNESLRKTAKLSKSLRDIVRSSVSPEAGVTLFGDGAAGGENVNAQNTLSKLLIERSI